MFSNNSILAAKVFALSTAVSLVVCQPASAGIPVVDGMNLGQTTVTAINQVKQVAQQVKQYETQLREYTTQLQQYENMIQNTAAPGAYIWSEVNSVINKVVSAQQTLEYYKNQSGSIDRYLSKYENVNYYRNSPCFQDSGCSDSEREALETRRAESSEAVQRANADVIRSVDQQQQTLNVDAQKLQQLQSQATSATGHMQALQAANQLAAAQGNQLLQIRGMLLAQNQAAATLAQQQADRQAQEDASSTKLREKSNITRSEPSTWSFQ